MPLSKAERLANEQAGGKGYNPNPDPNPNPNPRPNPSPSPSASPISSPRPNPNPNFNPIPKQAGGKAPKGGVWAECTNNEWTLSTPQMSIDVGVIGPFEEGDSGPGMPQFDVCSKSWTDGRTESTPLTKSIPGKGKSGRVL